MLASIACSGGSTGAGCGGGCGGSGGCTQPIPGGFPAKERIPNAITAQLSAQGLQYFDQNLTALIGALTGMNNGLSVAVPCIQSTQNVAVIGNVTVSACCSAACDVQAMIDSAQITPSTASDGSVDIQITIAVNIDTGQIPVEVPVSIFGLGLCTISCDIDYNQQNLPVNVTLNLKVDPNWGNILAIQIMGIDLSSLINTNDLNINSQGGICSGIACGALDLSFVKSAIVGLIAPTLNSTVTSTLDKIRCQACDTNQFPQNGGCPVSTAMSSPPVATCDSSTKLCFVDKANDICAPSQLGLQGRMNVGSTLATFGAPADASLDIYAVAGGANTNGKPTTYVDSSGGVVLGIMGGTDSPHPSTCVPKLTPPVLTTPDPIDFALAAAEAGLPHINNYQVGLAIGAEYINKALFDAFNSGALCLNVGTSLTTLLASSLFQSTLTPSLGLLTHGENAPMMVVLRPKTAPSVKLGLGTTQMMNGMSVPLDPLLAITMKDLQLDFYAFIEDRQVRIFSLTTDIVGLPISLAFDGTAGTVTPALGSFSAAIQNPKVSNCDMLDSTDCMGLGGILGTLIGLIQGPLNSALANPIALPTVSGIKLGVEGARGAVAGRAGDAPGYQQLALFASLSIAGADTIRPHTSVEVVQGVTPALKEVLGAQHLQPYAVVRASGTGPRTASFAGYEYAYRVDGGGWSGWSRSEEFEVHDPLLVLESRHQIEVTSREIDQPQTQDPTPATVQFVVDYEPPRVSFRVDPSTQRLTTVATDTVWHDQLSYSYSLDGGSWSSPGPAQTFAMAEMSGRQSVEVEVTNGSGLKAKASYGAPRMNVDAATLAASAARAHVTAGSGHSGGCTQAGLPGAALAILGGILARRRRRA